jgi:DNA ligase (NAD+)
MKALIVSHGGKNSGSISGKTAFLLAGDKPGPEKIKKAESLGVAILSETEFRSMISVDGSPTPEPTEIIELTLF